MAINRSNRQLISKLDQIIVISRPDLQLTRDDTLNMIAWLAHTAEIPIKEIEEYIDAIKGEKHGLHLHSPGPAKRGHVPASGQPDTKIDADLAGELEGLMDEMNKGEGK